MTKLHSLKFKNSNRLSINFYFYNRQKGVGSQNPCKSNLFLCSKKKNHQNSSNNWAFKSRHLWITIK